jgi:tRNA dimethylallyltransferase
MEGRRKNGLCNKLCTKNNGEIIYCDSLLGYKQMEIGTAKPMPDEMRERKYYCIDLVEPFEKCDSPMFFWGKCGGWRFWILVTVSSCAYRR